VDADLDGFAAPGAATMDACACPSGYTTRNPVGAPDCDDTRDNTHPGAVELCDRRDNDCSSGGGPDASEDQDGDGYAALTAACSGGYPRTDCNDFVAEMHPGQTMFFTTPAYVSGCGTDALRCWDYDCDGRSLRQYRRTDTPSCDPVCSATGACNAGGAGFVSDTACGETNTLVECRGSCATTACRPCVSGCSASECGTCAETRTDTAQPCR
jgi:hypothetical protein